MLAEKGSMYRVLRGSIEQRSQHALAAPSLGRIHCGVRAPRVGGERRELLVQHLRRKGLSLHSQTRLLHANQGHQTTRKGTCVGRGVFLRVPGQSPYRVYWNEVPDWIGSKSVSAANFSDQQKIALLEGSNVLQLLTLAGFLTVAAEVPARFS